MLSRWRVWFDQLPQTSLIERRQARAFQAIVLGLVGIAIVGVLSSALIFVTFPSTSDTFKQLLMAMGTYSTMGIGAAIALQQLRRNHLQRAAMIVSASIQLMLLIGYAVVGILRENSTYGFIFFAIPLIISALLNNRNVLILNVCISILIVTSIGILESTEILQPIDMIENFWVIFVTMTIAIVSQALLVERFGSSLHMEIYNLIQREDESQHLQHLLEQKFDERNQSLQNALNELAQREKVLQQALSELQTSQTIVAQLNIPVIPVLPRVLIAPLIGEMTAEHAQGLKHDIFTAIERSSAHTIILDITGVSLIDRVVAETIIQIAKAAQLLGTKTILVGLRPEVATALVSLDMQANLVKNYLTLEKAIQSLLQTHIRRAA
ncbi:MAG TPA: STAS domain-containing protein [Herpetosiphon sp.]|uniref:Anti-sigma-factor antagonist n=1 Tax=Herpetosiphon aurantiacus (strain ATCC 23779 / DSM 785 / 114-95) TaxID=316274 RepID=A9AXA4_HERA2|nr:STAS domain-containing protein [Herpetosiphon sp.]ABX06824.1 anti-sigma-factor antagonist [Herpetosiphon aurantiacus DSM 785]HBW52827.1 STAS domain-containing protein [Herpetosiphon sp.]